MATDTATDAAAGAPAGADGAPDGRRLRRERNRDAVVEALLALYREGDVAPSSETICARAGLSARSLFRYFDDVDDLAQTAIDRAQQQVRHLVEVDAAPSDPLRDRIEALVASRAGLFEEVAPVAAVSRLRAASHPVVAANLRRTRAFLRDQVRALFAPELDAMAPADAAARLAAADVATSFEAHVLLRDDQALDPAAARAATTATLTLLLGPGGPQ